MNEQGDEHQVFAKASNPDVDPEDVKEAAKKHAVDTIVIIGGDGTDSSWAAQTFKEKLDELKLDQFLEER